MPTLTSKIDLKSEKQHRTLSRMQSQTIGIWKSIVSRSLALWYIPATTDSKGLITRNIPTRDKCHTSKLPGLNDAFVLFAVAQTRISHRDTHGTTHNKMLMVRQELEDRWMRRQSSQTETCLSW